MAKLKIVGSGISAKLYIDDLEVKGITNYELIHDGGNVPEIKLTIPAHEVDINTSVIPELPDIYKKFYKRTDELPKTYKTHLEVKITEMETFKKVLNLLMDFVCDERVNKDLRYSYFGKLQKIKE